MIIYSVMFCHCPDRRDFTPEERKALNIDADDNCLIYQGEHPLEWMQKFPPGSVFEISVN